MTSEQTGALTGRGRAFDRFSRAVEGPMTVLALAMVPILLIPLAVHLTPAEMEAFDVADFTIWALFALEYGTKLYLAPDRKSFVRHNLLDLVIILIPLCRPLRIIRAARLLRLLQLIRLLAFVGEGLRRARSLLRHGGLQYVLLVGVIVVFAGAGLEFAAEHNAAGSNIHNYGDALWWAMVTIATVGYGDRFPVTASGKGVAIALMIMGIALFGILAGALSSFFVGAKQEDMTQQLGEVAELLDRIEAGLDVSGRLDQLEAMLRQLLVTRHNGERPHAHAERQAVEN